MEFNKENMSNVRDSLSMTKRSFAKEDIQRMKSHKTSGTASKSKTLPNKSKPTSSKENSINRANKVAPPSNGTTVVLLSSRPSVSASSASITTKESSQLSREEKLRLWQAEKEKERVQKGLPPKKSTVAPAAPTKKPVALARKPIFGFEMSALRQAIKEARSKPTVEDVRKAFDAIKTDTKRFYKVAQCAEYWIARARYEEETRNFEEVIRLYEEASRYVSQPLILAEMRAFMHRTTESAIAEEELMQEIDKLNDTISTEEQIQMIKDIVAKTMETKSTGEEATTPDAPSTPLRAFVLDSPPAPVESLSAETKEPEVSHTQVEETRQVEVPNPVEAPVEAPVAPVEAPVSIEVAPAPQEVAPVEEAPLPVVREEPVQAVQVEAPKPAVQASLPRELRVLLLKTITSVVKNLLRDLVKEKLGQTKLQKEVVAAPKSSEVQFKTPSKPARVRIADVEPELAQGLGFEEAKKASPTSSSIIVLTPVSTSKSQRMSMKSSKVLTPARRSTRISGAYVSAINESHVADLLKQTSYSYSPNVALSNKSAKMVLESQPAVKKIDTLFNTEQDALAKYISNVPSIEKSEENTSEPANVEVVEPVSEAPVTESITQPFQIPSVTFSEEVQQNDVIADEDFESQEETQEDTKVKKFHLSTPSLGRFDTVIPLEDDIPTSGRRSSTRKVRIADNSTPMNDRKRSLRGSRRKSTPLPQKNSSENAVQVTPVRRSSRISSQSKLEDGTPIVIKPNRYLSDFHLDDETN